MLTKPGKPNGKCDTATLLRGRTYTVRSVKFEKGVPRRVDDETAIGISGKDFLKELEDEADEVPDGEGEVFEKPRFRIDRNVDDPGTYGQTRARLSATREVRTLDRIKPLRRRLG